MLNYDQIFSKAREFVDECRPAIAGEMGQLRTFKLAGILRVEFDLDKSDSLILMGRWNSRCVPPWTVDDMRRKIEDVHKMDERKLRNLIGNINNLK